LVECGLFSVGGVEGVEGVEGVGLLFILSGVELWCMVEDVIV